MIIKDAIRGIRNGLGMTQQQFADELGIKRSLIGAYEEGRAEPRLELLHRMADLGGITLDNIFNAKAVKGNASGVRINGFRNSIPLVPVKAAAGYLKGYDDPEVINELPLISIPFLGNGDFRAFEITGESMLPITSGSIIIGERLNDFNQVKNGRTYIFVTRNEGLVYKRVKNEQREIETLQLLSDNPDYPAFSVSGDEILETWAAKAIISQDIP